MDAQTTTKTARQKYAGKPARGYCTNPTNDVPILEPVHLCAAPGCAKPVEFDRESSWQTIVRHADGTDDGHYVRTRGVCNYCGSGDNLIDEPNAWAVIIACTRCGGRSGFGLGD